MHSVLATAAGAQYVTAHPAPISHMLDAVFFGPRPLSPVLIETSIEILEAFTLGSAAGAETVIACLELMKDQDPEILRSDGARWRTLPFGPLIRRLDSILDDSPPSTLVAVMDLFCVIQAAPPSIAQRLNLQAALHEAGLDQVSRGSAATGRRPRDAPTRTSNLEP